MPLYSTKPHLVEARQFTGGQVTGQNIANWCGGAYITESKASDWTDVFEYIHIPTLNGPLKAPKTSWVIRDPKTGQFSVSSDHEFRSTYNYEGDMA